MLDYTIFGESHGPAVGVLVTGAAPGLPVDRELIARELQVTSRSMEPVQPSPSTQM